MHDAASGERVIGIRYRVMTRPHGAVAPQPRVSFGGTLLLDAAGKVCTISELKASIVPLLLPAFALHSSQQCTKLTCEHTQLLTTQYVCWCRRIQLNCWKATAHLNMYALLLLVATSTSQAPPACVVSRSRRVSWTSCQLLMRVLSMMSPQILNRMVTFFVFCAQRHISDTVRNLHVASSQIMQSGCMHAAAISALSKTFRSETCFWLCRERGELPGTG